MQVIPLRTLFAHAGSKTRVALLAGRRDMGRISDDSVLIDGKLYVPSAADYDWENVLRELVEEAK